MNKIKKITDAELGDIVVTHFGSIRKICDEDMPLCSMAEMKRFATKKEIEY